MSVPKPNNVSLTTPEYLPSVPDILVQEVDQDISSELWRTREVDSSVHDHVGLYYGSPDVQRRLLVNENAAHRIRRTQPFVFDALVVRETLTGYINEPPLTYIGGTNDLGGKSIWMDPQFLQKGGSFKDIGAAYYMSQILPEDSKTGVKAITRGNHGIGVARAGSFYHIPVTIFGPSNMSAQKKRRMKAFGAKVVEVPGDFEDAEAVCCDVRSEHADAKLIHPYNEANVFVGQSVIGLNHYLNMPDVANVVFPIGGGGLIARSAAVLKQLNPNIKVYGAVHEAANSARLSKLAGKIVRLNKAGVFSDGTAVCSPGDQTLPYITHFVDEVLEVDSYTTARTRRTIHESTRIRLETAGILATAAVVTYPELFDGKTIVVGSGQNFDESDWQRSMQLACRTSPTA